MAAAPFRLAVSLPPDREEELLADGICTFCEISRGHLSVMRFDTTAGKAVDHREWALPYSTDDARWASVLRTVFLEEKISGLKAAVVMDVRTSVVPTDLMPPSTEGRDAILSLELGDLTGHDVVTADMEAWDAVAVSVVPSAVRSVLGSAVVIPELAAWSGELLRHTGQGHRAHILMGQRRFSLAITKGRSLLLHNAFDHDAGEDVLYFVLAALEQLEIPRTEVGVTVSGHIQKDDDLMELLRRYVPRTVLSERAPGITFAYSFKELPAHRSPLLPNLPSCV